MVALDMLRERFLGGHAGMQVRRVRSSVLFGASAGMLIASMLLGGGTRGGFLSDAILETLAIPALIFAVASLAEVPWRSADAGHGAYWALTFCVAIAFLPLFQLVPLPPWIWTRLGGREAVAAVFDTIGGGRPWLPISVAPDSTRVSVLSLLSPYAILLATIQLGYRARRWLSLLAIAIGVVSVFLGLTQLKQGPESSLRFFAFTNTDDAVGFFANRNHFAALLYALLPFTAAWTTDVIVRPGAWKALQRLEPRVVVPLTGGVMAIVVLLVGEFAARSRAGLGLSLLALAGGVALAVLGRRTSAAVTPRRLALAAAALVLVLAAQFGLSRALERFTSDQLGDARLHFARNTTQAALAFMPFGSGVGTFVPVYAMFEKPADTSPGVYANHAHDDYLEVWLESGVMGVGLMALFVVWFAVSGVRVWRRPPNGAGELDWSLVRAATFVIALLLIHSAVDYPLRTGAMMAIFALACALLVEPLRPSPREPQMAESEARTGEPASQHEFVAGPHVGEAAPDFVSPARPAWQPVLPLAQQTETPARSLAARGGRWGEEIEWPDEWRKSPGAEEN